MPPEYLTRAEADQRFRELEASMNMMAVENATRDGKVEGVLGAVQRIETMLKDKSQQMWTLAIVIISNLVTIAVAVYAKGP